MSINLIESIQTKLGYPELNKVDPNTQEVKEDSSLNSTKNIGQAAIPAVLMGLYRYGSTEQGSENILKGNVSSTWMEEFFGENKSEAIQKISSYSGEASEEVERKTEQIAREGIMLIRENVKPGASAADVKSFISEQRNNILPLLPAELQINSLFDDSTMDDRTNKMEGPMSNSMHFFEKLFSGSSSEKNDTTNDDDTISK